MELKFYKEDILTIGSTPIKICDSCGNILLNGKTNSFGIVSFCFEKDGLYRIFIEGKEIGVYLKKCKKKISIPIGLNSFKRFLLTDATYQNLPIEKGELNLWQKNITSLL